MNMIIRVRFKTNTRCGKPSFANMLIKRDESEPVCCRLLPAKEDYCAANVTLPVTIAPSMTCGHHVNKQTKKKLKNCAAQFVVRAAVLSEDPE